MSESHSPHAIRAKKSLWQNFLIDPDILTSIVESTEISGRNILEVGPWYGALTEEILRRDPKCLDLVELDPDMISILDRRIREEWSYAPIRLSHWDILSFRPDFSGEPYRVIANIPYYITSPILEHFLSGDFPPPEAMVIMMQEEVGVKILGYSQRRPRYSPLALDLHLCCSEISEVTRVPQGAFSPVPQVDSIVLRFVIRETIDGEERKWLSQLWRVAFAHPRKTLASNLSTHPDRVPMMEALVYLGYDSRVRAETVSLEHWRRIYLLSREK